MTRECKLCGDKIPEDAHHNRVYCEIHKDKKKRVEEGYCITCQAAPSLPDKSHCEKCRETIIEYKKERYRTDPEYRRKRKNNNKKYYRKMKEKGLCPACGNPSTPTSVYCEEDLEKLKNYSRNRHMVEQQRKEMLKEMDPEKVLALVREKIETGEL